MDRVLYVPDVSKRIRKHPETIRRWIRERKHFCFFIKNGREWSTLESRLEKWLKDGI